MFRFRVYVSGLLEQDKFCLCFGLSLSDFGVVVSQSVTWRTEERVILEETVTLEDGEKG